MATNARVWPDIAIPPGETVAGAIVALGISQAELARRMGRPPQVVNEIIHGSKEITPETAIQLERVLGVPAHVWVRLQADYDCTKARLADAERVAKEIPLAEEFPYNSIANLGWVPRAKKPEERAENLLRFFGVASLASVPQPSVALRRTGRTYSARALAAWLRQGERAAQKVEVAPFNADALRALIPKFSGYTRQEPEQWFPKLQHDLASCGIVLVVLQHLPGMGAYGAARWLAGKVLIQLCVIRKYEDQFWFTFFHELAHVLQQPQTDVIEFEGNGKNEAGENAANACAQNWLVPPDRYHAWTLSFGTYYPSTESVRRFAADVGIAPAVVVGRLQSDGKLPHTHLNGLRRRFDIKET